MKNPFSLKTILSPFVAIAFGVIAATGVLLFFHVKNGPIMMLHEWFGWAFTVAGAVHLLLNWRPLVAYLRVSRGLVSLTVAVVLGISLVILGLNRRGGPGHGPRGERPPLAEINVR